LALLFFIAVCHSSLIFITLYEQNPVIEGILPDSTYQYINLISTQESLSEGGVF